MNPKKADIEALIGSLDPVLANDPPARWRPTCETLRRELDAAEKLDHSCRVVGPAIAFVAFVILEREHLTFAAAAPMSLIGVCTLTAAFAPNARARLSALALILPLLIWLGSFIADTHSYAMLAVGIDFALNYLLARFYPALDYRERITFLLKYFGFTTETANVPS